MRWREEEAGRAKKIGAGNQSKTKPNCFLLLLLLRRVSQSQLIDYII
jgi:hypothetical protein